MWSRTQRPEKKACKVFFSNGSDRATLVTVTLTFKRNPENYTEWATGRQVLRTQVRRAGSTQTGAALPAHLGL